MHARYARARNLTQWNSHCLCSAGECTDNPPILQGRSLQGIFNQYWRREERDWRKCEYRSATTQSCLRRLSKLALSTHQNRTLSQRLRHPVSLKSLYRLESLDSVRGWIAQEWSWLIPVRSLRPWQQTWSNGEHRGVGSRQAGATLCWKEEPQQAAPSLTAVSDRSKPCAAWPIYLTPPCKSLCFRSTSGKPTVNLRLL
jgi:hypothetical protein